MFLLILFYVYDPSKHMMIFLDTKLGFLDPLGNYVREISDDNKMFYQYVGDLSTNYTEELYSPFRTILSPTAQQFGKANLSLNLNEVFNVEGQII